MKRTGGEGSRWIITKIIILSPEPYLNQRLRSLNKHPVVQYLNKEQLQKLIVQTQKKMEDAARELNFMEAARHRDDLSELKGLLEKAK